MWLCVSEGLLLSKALSDLDFKTLVRSVSKNHSSSFTAHFTAHLIHYAIVVRLGQLLECSIAQSQDCL